MIKILLTVITISLFSCHVVSADDKIIVTTSDFSSGSLASVDLATDQTSVNILNIHSDADARTYQGKLYVVNREGQDNILVLDGDDLSTPLTQFSVGNGTNPQDIVFTTATRAYVSRRASTHLLIVNPTTGDSLGSVDLSFAADDDGLPEMKFLTQYGNRLYVTCQRLDRNAFSAPTDRSEVVVVDLVTDTVVDVDSSQEGVQGIILQAKNPFGGQVRIADRLYISCVGDFNDLTDGGIEVVNLKTNSTEGIQLGEGELGGNVGALAMVSQNVGFVVVSDATFANVLKTFDLSTDGLPTTITGVSGGYIASMGIASGRLYVSDQGTFGDPNAGLMVFDVNTHALLMGPVSTGLPPTHITFLVEAWQSDFNGDRVVDFADFVLFARAFGDNTGVFDPSFDIDGDGKLEFSDFVEFVKYYGYRG
jgi:DNA-binding beta-propeller fold protein YncE